MELSGYLVIIRRWWWTLLVAVWVGALAGYLVGSRIQPTYEAQVKLLVGPINTDIDTLRAAGQLVQTYSELVTSQPIVESTIRELDLPMSPAQLRATIGSTADDVTRLLTITVEHGDAQQAADIAATLADELIQLAAGGTSRPEGELQIVEFPEVPTSPVAPNLSLLAALAAGASLVGAFVLVVLIEYLSDSLRSEADLESLSGVPMLGEVSASESSQVRLSGQLSAELRAEPAYRLIRLKAEAGSDQLHRSVMFLAPQRQPEIADIALAHAATAAASTGVPVVLLDVGGELSEALGTDERPGLVDWLSRESAPIEEFAVRHPSGVVVVPLGDRGAGSEGSLERALEAFGRMPPGAEVVVNGGSLPTSPTGLSWARYVGGVVLVAAVDRTRRQNVREAAESVRAVGANLVGGVLVRGRSRKAGRGQVASLDPVLVGSLAGIRRAGAKGPTRPRRARSVGLVDEIGPEHRQLDPS